MAISRTIRTRKTAADIRRIVRSLPKALKGANPEGQRVQAVFFSRFAHSLMTDIHTAFMAKSKGGQDELGNQWRPLAESTIRRKLAAQARRDPNEYDLLPKRQLTQWAKWQAAAFGQLRGTMSAKQAQEKANYHAWVKMRTSKGGSSGRVPIGIDKGDLERSLRPGSLSPHAYAPPKDQVYEVRGETVTIGTDVEHAVHFHRKRRIWPTPRGMKPWLRRAAMNARAALAQHLESRLS